MSSTSFVERDRQIATAIKQEIERLLFDKQRFGWQPHTGAWNRAFGKLAGLHLVLSFVENTPVPSEFALSSELENLVPPFEGLNCS